MTFSYRSASPVRATSVSTPTSMPDITTLLAEDLELNASLLGTIELRNDDALPRPEFDLSPLHGKSQRPGHQHGPQVGAGVRPRTVRVLWIIVQIVSLILNEVGEELFHVLDEGGLKLVDEEDGGGVQGVQEQDPIANRVLVQEVPNGLGDVQELQRLLRLDRDGLKGDPHGTLLCSPGLLTILCDPFGGPNTRWQRPKRSPQGSTTGGAGSAACPPRAA